MECFADVRYAFRTLMRRPGFAVLVVLAASLGIAANTSVFSMVNAVLLRPFPYPDPERLLLIEGNAPRDGYLLRVSYPDFSDWRAHAKSFESMAAYRYWGFNLGVGSDVERVSGLLASLDLFPLLGIEPHLGRNFRNEECLPGAPRVTLISDGLWRRYYASRPDILGQTLTLDGQVYRVIGVMPPGFEFPESSQVWVPLAVDATRSPRDERNLRVLGRLRAGIDLSQASREMGHLARRLEMEYPETNGGVGVHMVPLRDFYVENARPRLLAALGAVGFVLLVACVNVANLQSVRNASRMKEIAARAALGASPRGLFRLLLTESLLLALLSGAVGLLLAYWILELFVDLIPVALPFWLRIDMDVRVFVFTLALSMATGLLFGVIPAARSLRINLHTALKESHRRSVGTLQQRRSSRMLVVLEVGLTAALLIVAALTGRSFLALQEADLGFRTGGVLSARIVLPEADYGDPIKQRRFYQRLLESLEAVGGVRSAAATSRLPLTRSDRLVRLTVEGRRAARQVEEPIASLRVVSEEYFDCLGIPLLSGRTFREQDDSRSEGVLVASATLARLLFPQHNPIGRRLKVAGSDEDAPWLTIVGVVEDVDDYGPSSPGRPAAYVPYQQFPNRFMGLVLGGSHAPENLTHTVREVVRGLDPNLPVFDVRTMGQIVEESFWQNRFFAVLFAFFAAIALTLACVGLYGVVSYSARQRTSEIAIRMSFGAGPVDTLRLVAAEAIVSVAAGLVLGTAAALGLTRFISNLLFGLTATDPATFAGVMLILGVVAFSSCLIPAVRASRIDPIANLASE